MASARFRLGTAATNSAGTVWSWRAYDTAADISSGSYVKVELESTNGVRTLSVSIPAADEQTMSAGVPTVTTVQSSKTATFQAGTGQARTYLIRAQINSGIDQNGDTVTDYTKQLAAHILTSDGFRLMGVGETDEADRTYGYTSKLNAMVRGFATAGNLPTGTVNQVIQYDSSGSAQSTSTITLSSVSTPSTSTGAGIIYSSGGALLFRGGSGTITVIAPA